MSTREYTVRIPNDKGDAFISSVTVQIPVEVDEVSGEFLIGDEAQKIIDDTRARHMGLLVPEEIKALRERLKLTQQEMSTYLGCGEKSYCRWENGSGRQSRMVNNFLLLLRDGRISYGALGFNSNRYLNINRDLASTFVNSQATGAADFWTGYLSGHCAPKTVFAVPVSSAQWLWQRAEPPLSEVPQPENNIELTAAA